MKIYDLLYFSIINAPRFIELSSMQCQIVTTVLDAMLNVTTIAALLIIGGVETNPGPTNNQKVQLQVITQNARGINDAKYSLLTTLKVLPALPGG